jgi:hypothetical protein
MRLILLAALAALASFTAAAEEGMWTFDNPPMAAVQQKYGVTLDLRLAQPRPRVDRAARNRLHRLVHLRRRTDPDQPPLRRGLRRRQTRRRAMTSWQTDSSHRPARRSCKCPDSAVSVLVASEDVTAKVAAARRGRRTRQAGRGAPRRALTKLEQACEEASKKSKGGALKCERLALYQGGQYWLYKYRRYEDVRLVFRAGIRHGAVRRRPGQLPVPALVPRHVAAARLRGRKAC